MAIDYYVEFITVPVAVLVLALLSPPFDNVALDAWIVGYLAWVMIEYWMHRWLFHVKFRREHMIHHHRPFDPDGSPGTWYAQGALLAVTLAQLALLGQYLGCALAGGLLLGYWSYIGTHHVIHAGWLKPSNGVRQRHDLHHRGVAKNYNLLNPLGDLIFGTYVKPKR